MEIKFMRTIYGLIAVLHVLCSQVDSIGTNTNNPKKKGKASRKDKEVEEEIISHADDYLRALEIFNQTDIRTFEISCGLLASSIKALIVTSVTNFGREYSAPLFVYPTWKPKRVSGSTFKISPK
ncbi:unnamed protein product [Bemisia tabaci]|uniref:Uncharacterized protein n=1 Tax=Bemisia tabaci TaxID=7038 RepID=A0A9P0G2R7_BEMTA|nr:unnamed protein product [Bemisia tabaci]